MPLLFAIRKAVVNCRPWSTDPPGRPVAFPPPGGNLKGRPPAERMMHAAHSGWSHSVPLLAGDAGTSQTIDLIRANVSEGMKDPVVRQTLASILMDVPAHSDLLEVQSIYNWVKRNIRYTKDPINKELVSTAKFILTSQIGDCDDINAVLLPTLLQSAGYPCRLVTIASNPYSPGQFSHIYSEVLVKGRWIPIDAARPGAKFGVAPSRAYRRQVWELATHGSGVSGLGFDWSSLTKMLPGITTGAAQIVSAAKGTPSYSLPLTTQQTPGATYYAPSAGLGIGTGTLLLLGAGALAVVALSRRK